MNNTITCFAISLVCGLSLCAAQDKPGATIPWATTEAENMHTTGTVLGPKYDPFMVETESSGLKCVKLADDKQFVEFAAPIDANAMVIRYSLPDAPGGGGVTSGIRIYKNGLLIERRKITSHYMYLYGKYPFSNNPAMGETRHFYDELRMKDLKIAKGDVIRIKREILPGDAAAYCIIDLVDLENIAPALPQPDNSLSVTDKSFLGDGFAGDYTNAFKNCIAKAQQTGKTVWIPPGTYQLTGDIILPENIAVQGAGMWYTELVGDEKQYADATKRVRLKGDGGNIRLADFAITGNLDYRNDNEPNDGIVGSFGANSTITNIWIEHTKVGMWIENSQNLKINGCRMRNTIADGINFCVGMSHSSIENCTARGTGDDCFAFWPAVYAKQTSAPGHNRVVHCTGQLPYLANGAAIYGAESNSIESCSFTDISQGSAILISTTFPTQNGEVNNNFSGTTIVKDCDISTSGGFDHEWDWRAAVEICVDRRNIAGLAISNLNIYNSLSSAVRVIAKNTDGQTGALTNAALQNVRVFGVGIGTAGSHGLAISAGAHGSLTLTDCSIGDISNGSGDFTVK